VLSAGGAVASSQPLATRAGLRILDAGGTAADAAVATAAALQVTQACSTGLGGDAFCLYYEAATGRLHGLNGSGRAPAALSMEKALRAAREDGADDGNGAAVPPALPLFHPHTVTVPGAAAAWWDTHAAFGRLPFGDLLVPALRLARDGFPVAPYTAGWWSRGAERQLAHSVHGGELMLGGRGPRAGELMRIPTLATTLEALAAEGPEVFYRGWIAERIVRVLREAGGLMTMDDLAAHASEWVDPIGVPYGGYTVWECPPNGQGVAALMALGIHDAVHGGVTAAVEIEAGRNGTTGPDPAELNTKPNTEPTARDYHLLIESMRHAFADARRYVADPAAVPVPTEGMIDPAYLAGRAALIDPERRCEEVDPGLPPGAVGDDTVYFCVVDADGNACSFINSNYMGFGTGIVPEGCGFSLQNRGRGFVLDEAHPNRPAPGKRPYHTIIPGMITRPEGGVAAAFGVMGGMMQPQGHLQLVDALIRRGVDPQAALDGARFQLADGDPNGRVFLEADDNREQEGSSFHPAATDPAAGLRERGHEVELVSGSRRAAFGLGQLIWRAPDGVLWCGSDPRGDGCALGQ